MNYLLTDSLVSGKLYLRTLFSISLFSSQSNSVFTHLRKRTLKRVKIRFFFYLTDIPCIIIDSWQHKTWPLTEKQNSGYGFCQISICSRESKLFVCMYYYIVIRRVTLLSFLSPTKAEFHLTSIIWCPLMWIILARSTSGCPLRRLLTV